jgi:hypothetical protein
MLLMDLPIMPAKSSGISMLLCKTLQMGKQKGASVDLRGSPEYENFLRLAKPVLHESS